MAVDQGDRCTHCGQNIFDHEPLFVESGVDLAALGQFCNWACLSAHIDEENLAEGATCEI